MHSQASQDWSAYDKDEAAIIAIQRQMIDAWNNGSGERFASVFTETADFIAFEGTHLKGRREIAYFHQPLFDTSLKGTRLDGEVKFVRFLNPQLAIMHSTVRVTLSGENKPSPGRDSMQLFVVVKDNEGWRAESLLNARILTLERQFLLDDLDSLPAAAQRQVARFIESLKQHHQTEKDAL
jgi:uncharacterized protein (TIGR02246 family)